VGARRTSSHSGVAVSLQSLKRELAIEPAEPSVDALRLKLLLLKQPRSHVVDRMPEDSANAAPTGPTARETPSIDGADRDVNDHSESHGEDATRLKYGVSEILSSEVTSGC
jgi:hypothetical protein